MDKICITCEKSFYVSPSREHIKNCSYLCNKLWRKYEYERLRTLTIACACGCETQIPVFGTATHKRRYVIGHQMRKLIKPRIVKTNHQVGSNHWNWKGGITSQEKLQRDKFHRYFRPKVMSRDNYTCQVCDSYGGELQVDHIKSWAENPEGRFDLNNCRTLCKPCHYYLTFKKKMPVGITWGRNLSRRIGQ